MAEDMSDAFSITNREILLIIDTAMVYGFGNGWFVWRRDWITRLKLTSMLLRTVSWPLATLHDLGGQRLFSSQPVYVQMIRPRQKVALLATVTSKKVGKLLEDMLLNMQSARDDRHGDVPFSFISISFDLA